MPSPPPALLIHCLVYRDAIDPGLQSRLAAKPAESSIDLQECLLRRVTGLLGVAQQSEAKRIDRSLEVVHQFLECGEITRAQSGDQPGLREVLYRPGIEL